MCNNSMHHLGGSNFHSWKGCIYFPEQVSNRLSFKLARIVQFSALFDQSDILHYSIFFCNAEVLHAMKKWPSSIVHVTWRDGPAELCSRIAARVFWKVVHSGVCETASSYNFVDRICSFIATLRFQTCENKTLCGKYLVQLYFQLIGVKARSSQ